MFTSATRTKSIRAVVTLHDVMPNNLAKIDRCLRELEHHSLSPCYLLVVPGLNWNEKTIAKLRHYVSQGHVLVAHGWVHKAHKIHSLYHRLHSVIISRDVAEHLSLSQSERVTLMTKSRTWFKDNHLPIPNYYVPPAWALGRLRQSDLHNTGFTIVENISGMFDTNSQQFQYMPLVGFETDTTLRAISVRLFNALNLFVAQAFPSRRLRVAIHPDDFDLRLANSLNATLTRIRAENIDIALASPNNQANLA